MSSSRYSDGKVLRSKDTRLFAPDLQVLINLLETGGHSGDDLRTLDHIVDKIRDGNLEEFIDEYTAAKSAADLEIEESNIVNGAARDFIVDQHTTPVYRKYATSLAPDVLISISDWSWIKRKLSERNNLSGDERMRKRSLRILDAVNNALGYRLSGADKTVEIEGESKDKEAKLHAV